MKSNRFCKPYDLADIVDPPQNQIEEKTGQPYYLILSLLSKLERFCVVDTGALDLLLNIADNKKGVFEREKVPLQKLKFIKNNQSIAVYKSLYSLLCMSQTMSIFKKESKNPNIKKEDLNLPEVTPLLSIISMHLTLDTHATEGLLMVAHGNMDKGNHSYFN